MFIFMRVYINFITDSVSAVSVLQQHAHWGVHGEQVRDKDICVPVPVGILCIQICTVVALAA